MPEKFKLKRNEKHIYLDVLKYIISIGKEDPQKWNFIEYQMKKLDIPLDELDKTKNDKDINEIVRDIKNISSLKIKKYILREMILLSVIDHELSDEEITTVYKIGIEAEIPEDVIDNFFLWAAKGLEWQIEGVELLS